MKRIRLVPLIALFACAGHSATEETATPKSDKEIVCFVYHRFGDTRFPSTNISLQDFEAHLAWLTEQHYQVLSLADAIAYLHSDQPVQKTAVLTIDDGYKSFYRNGLPLLKKYKMPATLFINTQTVGGGDYMGWSELKEAMTHQVEIGNHTHSHNYFLNEPAGTRYESFRKELEQSQELIEKNLDVKPNVFAYPYGELDSEMKSIVKQAGFRAAAAQNSGVIYGGSDLFQCPRFPMSEAYAALSKFKEKALMRPLRVLRQSPESFIMPKDNPPLLTLTLSDQNLILDRLQCFVQGGTCQTHITDTAQQQITITLKASAPLKNRRRTLYTLTVPDKSGAWHWYSHLWIEPAVK